MEKVEKSNTAMMSLLLPSQAEARKEMLQLEKKRMEQDEKLAKMENERNNQFMIFMKDMFTMMLQGPPLTPPFAGTMYYPPGPVSLPTPMYLHLKLITPPQAMLTQLLHQVLVAANLLTRHMMSHEQAV